VIALADREVFEQVLMPRFVTWYAGFAHNRMVIAYTARSKAAGEISAANWMGVLLRPSVETGRADPDTDPNGYRTLLTLQLAEGFYAQPGLAVRMIAAVPRRNIRANEAELVALVQAGELDYIWSYESIALAAGLEYLRLPSEIDLGDPALGARYAQASVRVTGRARGDTITIRGEPIVYALSIPVGAPHPQLAARFVAWLLGPDGRRVLRAARLDALDHPTLAGEGAPDAVAKAAAP
jgi:molybdate/tungstate transport system substrate-binding protein